MNLIDVVLAVLCVGFAVSGIFSGLARQLFSVGGVVAGHLVGIRFYGNAASTLHLSFKYGEVVGYLVVFLAVYLVFRLFGTVIEGRIRGSNLSGSDRLAGMIAGLAKGALVSVLLVFLLVIVLPEDSRVLRESKAAPVAISAGHKLASVFPDRLADFFREKVRAASVPSRGGSPSRK